MATADQVSTPIIEQGTHAMTNQAPSVTHLDHFFSTSAARLDRWRELNAKAQTWAAEAQSGKSRDGRAAVEAALVELYALEDFFAYPGPRLMKALAERISSDDTLGVSRLVRRISGSLLSGSYRYDGGEWRRRTVRMTPYQNGSRPRLAAVTPTDRTSRPCSSLRCLP